MSAYEIILSKLGIPSTYAYSESMNHIWNVLKIDGSWYHVDVTWNDSTGQYHRYFLRSDSALPDHSNWHATVRASSTKYDEAIWINTHSALLIHGDLVYMISSSGRKHTIQCWDSATNKTTSLFTFTATWMKGENPHATSGTYSPGYHGAISILNDRIYFVVPDGLKSISLAGTGERREMTIP